MLEIQQISKQFKSADRFIKVLDDVNFVVEKGETAAIVGPSGSGKTTLLGISAGLDDADTGKVLINGTSLMDLNEEERAVFRNEYVGFVFQNFQLISTLTALENVMVPAELAGQKGAEVQARDLLDKVGLSHRIEHYPGQLSGGEQQRVALARAFITQPEVLFADEPTGNLDAENSEKVESLMFELNNEHKTTLVIVTHDEELAAKCNRVIRLKAGQVVENKSMVAATTVEG
jgi:putative ABC transport system ATP-binding protein